MFGCQTNPIARKEVLGGTDYSQQRHPQHGTPTTNQSGGCVAQLILVQVRQPSQGAARTNTIYHSLGRSRISGCPDTMTNTEQSNSYHDVHGSVDCSHAEMKQLESHGIFSRWAPTFVICTPSRLASTGATMSGTYPAL